jgi:Periplasmic binding protein domain
VISTINGDANTYFYRELVAQEVDANAIPVMAFSVSERELLGSGIFRSSTWRPGTISSQSTHQRTKPS